jgi:hypothetical protein
MWHTNVAQRPEMDGLKGAETLEIFSDINELADLSP